jgi:DegV family protein with EDD domain
VSKVVVVTDSVATVPESLVRELDVRVVPIVLNHEGRSYRDGVDLNPNEFYQLLRTSEELPTSSTPSVGDIAQVYAAAARDSAGVVGIHVTSRLSAVYKTAVLAGQSVDAPIQVVDSRTATMAQGFVVVEAARSAAAGADLVSVVARATEMTTRVRFYAFFETLEYLHRGGRIGGAAALLGSALQFKPIIHLVDGQVEPYARPRTRRRATKTLLDIMAEQVGGRPVHVAVLHADSLDDAEELRQRVAQQFDCLELYVTEFTPVMGAHTGPGLLGLAFHVDQ